MSSVQIQFNASLACANAVDWSTLPLDLLIRWSDFRIPAMPQCQPIQPSGLDHIWLLNHSDTTFVFGEAETAGFGLKLIKRCEGRHGTSELYKLEGRA